MAGLSIRQNNPAKKANFGRINGRIKTKMAKL
jgi:hypothetical protein